MNIQHTLPHSSASHNPSPSQPISSYTHRERERKKERKKEEAHTHTHTFIKYPTHSAYYSTTFIHTHTFIKYPTHSAYYSTTFIHTHTAGERRRQIKHTEEEDAAEEKLTSLLHAQRHTVIPVGVHIGVNNNNKYIN